MSTAPAAVPSGSCQAGWPLPALTSSQNRWAPWFGALASGLAVAALLLGLVVMHAGLAPAMPDEPGMTAGAGASAMSMRGAAPDDSAASMADGATVRPVGEHPVEATAGSVLAAAAVPGSAGAGGMLGHAGGMMCLAVLTLFALSLVLSLRRGGRWVAAQPADLPAPARSTSWAAQRPPPSSAALARLGVLRT